MNSLNIFLLNRLVGVLELNKDNTFVFSYNNEYLESESAVPVSLTIPLKEGAQSHENVRSFFNQAEIEAEILQRELTNSPESEMVFGKVIKIIKQQSRRLAGLGLKN